MKTKILAYTLAAAGFLCGNFQSLAQQGGAAGRGPILSQEDRTAVQEATRDQLTKLREDLRAAQKAAVETALSENAKDEDVKAKLEAVSKIQNEIGLVYCKAVKKTVKLTEEQTNRMKENPVLGYFSLFGGGGFGFGGRGGGPRGGGSGAANQP